ncbi:MAG: hypothetical protein R6X02_05055 [Enhygromyxa sp.]
MAEQIALLARPAAIARECDVPEAWREAVIVPGLIGALMQLLGNERPEQHAPRGHWDGWSARGHDGERYWWPSEGW